MICAMRARSAPVISRRGAGRLSGFVRQPNAASAAVGHQRATTPAAIARQRRPEQGIRACDSCIARAASPRLSGAGEGERRLREEPADDRIPTPPHNTGHLRRPVATNREQGRQAADPRIVTRAPNEAAQPLPRLGARHFPLRVAHGPVSCDRSLSWR